MLLSDKLCKNHENHVPRVAGRWRRICGRNVLSQTSTIDVGLQTSIASLEPVSVDYMRPRKYRLRVCYLVQGTARPGRQGGTNGEAYRC